MNRKYSGKSAPGHEHKTLVRAQKPQVHCKKSLHGWLHSRPVACGAHAAGCTAISAGLCRFLENQRQHRQCTCFAESCYRLTYNDVFSSESQSTLCSSLCRHLPELELCIKLFSSA